MGERRVANAMMRVRFPLPAPKERPLFRGLIANSRVVFMEFAGDITIIAMVIQLPDGLYRHLWIGRPVNFWAMWPLFPWFFSFCMVHTLTLQNPRAQHKKNPSGNAKRNAGEDNGITG